MPAALWPAAYCNGLSEASSLSSALLLSSPPPLLLSTTSGAGVPKLHSESSQHHAVAKGMGKNKGLNGKPECTVNCIL